ncbi:Omp28-related outer membrane protein [Flavobacteriaceae bacterium W22]|nr:Omp28-related outer membrane protein [Flavobacteriaceae bacterium W22]
MKKAFSIIAISALFFTSCSSGVEEETSNSTPVPTAPSTPAPSTPGSTSGRFVKNVLIEDFTGTWCGYCPRVSYAIQSVLNQNITAIPVTVHRSSGTVTDPFHFQPANPLLSQMSITAYPTAMLDRKEKWTNEVTNTIQVKNLTGVNAQLGIAITSSIQNNTINMSVNTKFGANMSNLKLVVYVLENDLLYSQVNYTSYYGGASVIQNFDNDYVLRASLTNVLGDDIAGNTNAGNVFIKNFSLPVPSNISNVSKITFVAFILDSAGKVINVRSAGPNVSQTFQEQ